MKNVQRIIAAVVVVLALQFQSAFAQNALTVPPVPTEILVPPGNTVFLKGAAVGTQNYICQSSDSGFFWKFLGPQATLFVNFQLGKFQISQQITTHFLSANPAEGGLARPTWQGSADTSVVWGKAAGSSSNPAYVAPGAIPWLLVQIVGSQQGPMGGSFLTGTTYIHRVNTAGGIAPVTGCSAVANVGAVALVPYRTDYYFYKASN